MDAINRTVRADAVVIVNRVAYFYQEDRMIGNSDYDVRPKDITCDYLGHVIFNYGFGPLIVVQLE